MALLSGSPAIGAGTAVVGITTDQRGVARGSSVDIGAFQSGTYTLSASSPDNTYLIDATDPANA